jgi:DNA invertase Pin-like site-specific DNA recombinase
VTTESSDRPDRSLSAKITNVHRAKLAVVYVRQSTPQQITENRESLARQYALAEHASGMGWPTDRIIVIDEDLGLSGRSAGGRPGFQRLIAEVTMDHVGLVLGLEMSRFARSCKDWHHLLEVCGIFGALLADQDGVYDPSDPNDRLLLGLKGQISELELHTIRTRLERGRLNKAQRGELIFHAPIGYVKTPTGLLAFDPDEQVRAVVQLVFDKFIELGTAHALVRYMKVNHVRLGVRPIDGPNRGQLEWRPAYLSTLFRMLKNPAYAGTFAFGQRTVDPKRRRGDGQTPCVRCVSQAEWAVKLHDKWPGYITWDGYMRNRELLRRNRSTSTTPGHSGKGSALLAGLVVCSRCGRRMNVFYGSATYPRYECVGHIRSGERRTCSGITAKALDGVIALQILQVLTPAGIELSLTAAEDIERERGRLDAHWQAEVERAAYEVRLAERSYRAVDPENRLVARSLERQWENALRREQDVKEGYNRFRREAPRRLAGAEIERIRSLATDIPALWHSPDTLAKDRKEIVRALIERVTLTLHGNTEDAHVLIQWIGGSTSTLAVRRPISRYDRLADFSRLRECIAMGLRNGRTAAQIADQLNQEGFHPPSGRAEQFTPQLVSHVIYRLGLSKARHPAVSLAPHEWWIRDLVATIGITLTRFRYWIKLGYVHVRKVGSGHLVIWADADEQARLRRLRDHPRADCRHPYPDELTRPKNRSESTPRSCRPRSGRSKT